MKRYLSFILVFILAIALFTGCYGLYSNNNAPPSGPVETPFELPAGQAENPSAQSSGHVGNPSASVTNANNNSTTETQSASSSGASPPEEPTNEALTPEKSTPETLGTEALVHEALVHEASAPEASTPEASAPDASTPEASIPEASTSEKSTHEGSSGVSVVYITTDISSEGLIAIYKALNWTPVGSVAVKITTGEPPDSNYLRTELIGDLVRSVDGTFVECNTAYGGSRAGTAMHLQVAADHGYTAVANVDILDADGSMSLPVIGGTRLSENFVGANFANYDSYIVLSHFKGHAMAGFGGAIKNASIGLGSSEGKSWIHSAGNSLTNPWGGDQDAFLESMGEAAKAVSDNLRSGERIVYINVMNRLSVDCDCNGKPAEPDMHDIGILSSHDPVALDQACIDFVYAAEDGRSLINRIESRNGLHTLEHAEEIGLGSRTFELVSIDG